MRARFGLLALVAACGTRGASDDVADLPYCGDGHVDPGEECDDGNLMSGDGCTSECKLEGAVITHRITVVWSFRTVAGAALPCPATDDIARVISQPIDNVGHPIGAAFSDEFPCAALQGVTQGLPAGRYEVTLAIDDATMNKYASALPERVDINVGDTQITTEIVVDGGYFQLRWDLKGDQSGTVLDCVQAGIDTVEIDSLLQPGTMPFRDMFACSDHRGTTAALPVGNYNVAILAKAGLTIVGTASQTGLMVNAPNQVTDLGLVTIGIPGR